jgi:glutathione S-transferase
VSEFAARGGPKGAKNIPKSFGAPLADPYANSDDEVFPYYVDSALRVVCAALLDIENNESSNDALKDQLVVTILIKHIQGIIDSVAYLPDCVGVSRDLPCLASCSVSMSLSELESLHVCL